LSTSEPFTIRFYTPTLVRSVVGILKPTLPMGLSRWKPLTTLVPKDMISILSPCYFKAVTGCIVDRPGHTYDGAPQLLRLSVIWSVTKDSHLS